MIRLPKRLRAQTLPFAAMAMVAMVGGLAMVVDTGMFLVIQRQLQAAADAGALAGAWYPNTCPSGAEQCASGDAATVATQIALSNAAAFRGLCVDEPTVDVQIGARLNRPLDANTIVVTVSCDATYSFGRILPIAPSKHIAASAAAAIGNRATNGDIDPFTLTCPPPTPSPVPTPCRIARLID